MNMYTQYLMLLLRQWRLNKFNNNNYYTYQHILKKRKLIHFVHRYNWITAKGTSEVQTVLVSDRLL